LKAQNGVAILCFGIKDKKGAFQGSFFMAMQEIARTNQNLRSEEYYEAPYLITPKFFKGDRLSNLIRLIRT